MLTILILVCSDLPVILFCLAFFDYYLIRMLAQMILVISDRAWCLQNLHLFIKNECMKAQEKSYSSPIGITVLLYPPNKSLKSTSSMHCKDCLEVISKPQHR